MLNSLPYFNLDVTVQTLGSLRCQCKCLCKCHQVCTPVL
jgi:hypothetical protein